MALYKLNDDDLICLFGIKITIYLDISLIEADKLLLVHLELWSAFIDYWQKFCLLAISCVR